jgi:hypothetical protein
VSESLYRTQVINNRTLESIRNTYAKKS